MRRLVSAVTLLFVISPFGWQGTDAARPPKLKAGNRKRNPIDGATMVYVPPGSFMMGEPGAAAHKVTLTKGFWIYRTEVTNAQYKKFLAANPGQTPPVWWRDAIFTRSQLLPATGVDWNQADSYCKWAGGRLPTEAQWEYAARGPKSSIYPWGELLPDEERAVFGLLSTDLATLGPGPSRVGTRPKGASWCGALDMIGNVEEWCSDWHAAYPAPQYDPRGPELGIYRIVRGGAWDSPKDSRLFSSDRADFQTHYALPSFGFRCVVPETLK